jgi:hypothetical protein
MAVIDAAATGYCAVVEPAEVIDIWNVVELFW